MREVRLKKRDIVVFKLAVFFASIFVVGFLAYFIQPEKIMNFIIDWRWAALALAIILGVSVWFKVWRPSKKIAKKVQIKKVKKKRK
jgi:NhaP-type Na+/H+ or K+/H+ antiporter